MSLEGGSRGHREVLRHDGGNHIDHGFDGEMDLPFVDFGGPFADLGGGDGRLGVSDGSLGWGSIPVGPVRTSDVRIQGSEEGRCGKEIVD